MTDERFAVRGEEKPLPHQSSSCTVSGHDLSRAATTPKSIGALAPAKPARNPRRTAAIFSSLFSLALTAATACHSYHVETTVENRTGVPIQLLEVDYPSASFGADALAAGAIFHYRIQLQGSGPLKVQYTVGEGHQVQVTGPALAERQEGSLQIVLLPEGKAEFHPDLSPPR
jgi:hypothetical protein